MTNIAVITTFPNYAWQIYAKQMLQSFVQFWPQEIPLLIQLDDDLLHKDVSAILRPQDCVVVGWDKEHKAFVKRNKDKDSKTDYRKQAVRFCHKVFAIKRALDARNSAKKAGLEDAPRYLIWMDADVVTNRPVSIEEIRECLPKEGDAVAYLGRKDWDHSECGWLAFDLDGAGGSLIGCTVASYVTDSIFGLEQWHDSWVWDLTIKISFKSTDLTADKPGMDIWPHSPMGKWSVHHKGPAAKNNMAPEQQAPQGRKVIIQTKNAIPHKEIRDHIEKNQELIKEWIKPCYPTDEEIVVVSAGPMLVAEDVRQEVENGRKIVSVKHALQPLKEAGITPWASILLDPRPHVSDFVKDADPSILWFVASQVNPDVTSELLTRGCKVYGYHASVGAQEGDLTGKQPHSIIGGGSATATRGLFVMNHLGFYRFRLYGYDLCVPDKPDLSAKDKDGNPQYLEISIGINNPLYTLKRHFWTKPELIAQFEELSQLVEKSPFEIEAFGDGTIPFIVKARKVADLRNSELKSNILPTKPCSYTELLYGPIRSS